MGQLVDLSAATTIEVDARRDRRGTWIWDKPDNTPMAIRADGAVVAHRYPSARRPFISSAREIKEVSVRFIDAESPAVVATDAASPFRGSALGGRWRVEFGETECLVASGMGKQTWDATIEGPNVAIELCGAGPDGPERRFGVSANNRPTSASLEASIGQRSQWVLTGHSQLDGPTQHALIAALVTVLPLPALLGLARRREIGRRLRFS